MARFRACVTIMLVFALAIGLLGCSEADASKVLFRYLASPEGADDFDVSERKFGYWDVENSRITWDVQMESAESALSGDKGNDWVSEPGYPSEWMEEEEFAVLYPCTYGFDKTVNITYYVYLSYTGDQMYVASRNEETGEIGWKRFTYSGNSGINSIYAPDTVVLGQWIYGIDKDNLPVRVNVNDGSCEQLQEIAELKANMGEEGSYDPDGLLSILPCGTWEGNVIWNVPFCTDVTVTNWYCIYGEQFEGAVYIDESLNWHVYDRNWKERNCYEEAGRAEAFGL